MILASGLQGGLSGCISRQGLLKPVKVQVFSGTSQHVDRVYSYACLLVLLPPQAVMGARESLEGCFEVLQPQLASINCNWQDFLWAVQVCF